MLKCRKPRSKLSTSQIISSNLTRLGVLESNWNFIRKEDKIGPQPSFSAKSIYANVNYIRKRYSKTNFLKSNLEIVYRPK
jgi:hypothetical protein